MLFCCRIWLALAGLLLPPAAVAAQESPPLLNSWYEFWFVRFLVNVLGYSTIIVPGYLLICYFKRINYLETGRWDSDELGRHLDLLGPMFISWIFFVAFVAGGGLCFPVIKACVFGSDTKAGLLDDMPAAPRNEGDSGSSVRHYTKLIICAAGLQVGTLKHITRLKSFSDCFFCISLFFYCYSKCFAQ